MSDTEGNQPAWETLSADEKQAALFANLVMQQTNAALLMLGKVPHPETGKADVDLDGASLFIDTLEMLQARTRGNLSKPEEAMLKQSLTVLRMAYVEKVNAATTTKEPVAETASKPAAEPFSTSTAASSPPSTGEAEGESKKKFTKKY
jgi:hypothetical protein